MCGIAGFYSSKNRYTFDDLKRMTTALRHRGPNAEGFYNNGFVGLGHRRLSILDLSSSANQPMHSADDRYVIVFNGEIYNYRELAKKWNLSLKTSSDTEVLLEGFAKFGIKCLDDMNGMFAFAIYDKEEESLIICRDRIGVKPLFYHHDNQEFAFASETKSLLALGIERTIDITSLKDYLFLEYIPGDRSIFKHIKKLENGAYIKISKEGFKIEKYYDILSKYAPITNYNEKDLIDQLTQELSNSIKLQSVSDVPLGAFLSGGTDSSLICAIFQSQNQNPINTYTIGFEVKRFDEREYANKVASILRTNHHVSLVTEEESMKDVEMLPCFYDEPFAVPSIIPSLQVCKNASQQVTVAMSGDGGDELFMGYGYYNWFNRIESVNRLGGYPARKLMSTLFSMLSNPYKRGARNFDFKDYSRMWLHVWSQEQYMFNETEISMLFGEKYQHETLISSWESIDKMNLKPFEKISFFDIKNYLPNNLLYKMDIASMMNSIEVRVPYLDHNLVEFAINVPLEYKVRNGESKYLMKKVLERYLPNDLIYRKKWGFPAPVEDWLKNDWAPLIDIYLSKNVIERQAIFNYAFVDRLINDFRSGRSYHFKRIWALLFFQFWYKFYIDKSVFEE